jgi:rubrerythrin
MSIEDKYLKEYGETYSHIKEKNVRDTADKVLKSLRDVITKEELIRAIRFMVAAEYEAIQLYMQLAESTDNKLAIEVLKDIADEERVHAGEFLRLLHELAPDERKFYAEGAEEVEEEIAKMKKLKK